MGLSGEEPFSSEEDRMIFTALNKFNDETEATGTISTEDMVAGWVDQGVMTQEDAANLLANIQNESYKGTQE